MSIALPSLRCVQRPRRRACLLRAAGNAANIGGAYRPSISRADGRQTAAGSGGCLSC